jgi:hypothetical protein
MTYVNNMVNHHSYVIIENLAICEETPSASSPSFVFYSCGESVPTLSSASNVSFVPASVSRAHFVRAQALMPFTSSSSSYSWASGETISLGQFGIHLARFQQ